MLVMADLRADMMTPDVPQLGCRCNVSFNRLSGRRASDPAGAQKTAEELVVGARGSRRRQALAIWRA
jgi:hypothetical protein